MKRKRKQMDHGRSNVPAGGMEESHAYRGARNGRVNSSGPTAKHNRPSTAWKSLMSTEPA